MDTNRDEISNRTMHFGRSQESPKQLINLKNCQRRHKITNCKINKEYKNAIFAIISK